ncbi:DUF2752 domain-containing protein [Chitinophaga vietnamensis]|uniref:DUF2752 domain-containing protein n=1 Tax=Chitinophaga vietnamensis TaxID=2593957 RepID=UPI00137618F4|nr:DUF2752 domain-containing protein [Chitinophaga vietnamensis]
MKTAWWRKINLELIAWPSGLLLLFFLRPDEKAPSLCLLKQAGIPFCPGCGLGHGIHYFLHGQWREAIHHHWLAPVVAIMLMYRTIQLLRQHFAD